MPIIQMYGVVSSTNQLLCTKYLQTPKKHVKVGWLCFMAYQPFWTI